ALAELRRRRRSEIARFLDKYQVDISASAPFDLVIDTTLSAPEAVAEKVAQAAAEAWSGSPVEKIWASPRLLFPTRDVPALRSPEMEDLRSRMAAHGFDPHFPVEVLEQDDFYYVHDGHKRTSCAVLAQVEFVPVRIRTGNERVQGVPVRDYLRDHFSLAKA